MAVPTTMQALAMGARATGRSSWLVAPGLLIAFLRTALGWSAPLFALAMVQAGAAARLHQVGFRPAAVLAGGIEALIAPRSLVVMAGLWTVSVLLSAALRIAWMAGALPTLGDDLSDAPPSSSTFAQGIAFGFSPMLGTALLGFAIEITAQLYAASVYLGMLLSALRGGGGYPAVSAAFGAVALTSALAAPVVASLVADAALARNAIAGDRPTAAVAEGARRVVLRPGAFLLSIFVLGVAGAVVLGTASTLETAVLGVASGAPPLLALGPRLMATTLAAAVATLLELWRLGTIAALACSAER
jgi:hypothetical protein